MIRWIVALCAAAAGFAAPQAFGQAWPAKPVRMVVNFPPGGAVDQLARALAPRLQEAFGQPFVVENRPGANGSIGAGEVAKAAPDGYTILMSAGSSIAVNGLIYRNLDYDPMKALVPVAPVAVVSVFLETRATLPPNTLAEFVAHARANPGKLNYGSPGSGSSPHLAGEMFNRAAKIQTVHVPYKGAAPALTDLLAGTLDFMFDPGVGLPHVKAGKLKLLAVGSPRRHPQYPDVPTVAEVLGVEFDTDTVFGVYAPSGTPREIVARLNAAISREMQGGPVAERAHAIGAQPLVLAPEPFAARLRAEHERLAALVRETGLRAD
ncbi:MAG: tripartite tricarboxylate transporter substrate binding protein [Burkholderiales bacterium]|nr:tripartite tricarboxylate transporter substrate binding protein [Burkholderiales bacterium]